MPRIFLGFLGISSILLGLSLVSGIYLSNRLTVSAESVSKNARVTVAGACTLSTASGGTPHTAAIINGIYSGSMSEHSNGIGLTNLLASCNDSGGFSIYAVGYSNDTYGETDLIADNVNNTNIATGTAISGPTSAWAMKLSNGGASAPTITSAYTTFHAVPSTYDKVATHNAATTTNDGLSLTTTYATYISPTQMAGSYSGKVKYTLVHPASEVPAQPQTSTAGCINYFANASNAVGTMGCQSATDGQTKELLASNFSRTGYGFAGWSDAYDYETNQNAHFYGPQETITVPTGTTANGLSLYAVWVKSQGSLQDSSRVASVCNGLTAGATNLSSVSALTDARDNQTYAIAKLADNKCWMIENLRLESTNSDNSTGTLAQGYHSSFIGLSGSESANFTDSTTANNLYTTENNVTSKITISGSNIGYRFPRYNNTNTSARASGSNVNSNTLAMYSYGNYYTWHAAIADTTHYTGGDHGTTSVCPKGWRLPIGSQSTTDKSFGNLSVSLGGPENGTAAGSSSTPTGIVMSGVFRSYPNNFIYSGYFGSSSADNRGSNGSYLSSTAHNYFYSYGLRLSISYVSPGTETITKFSGFSIRCVSGS